VGGAGGATGRAPQGQVPSFWHAYPQSLHFCPGSCVSPASFCLSRTDQCWSVTVVSANAKAPDGWGTERPGGQQRRYDRSIPFGGIADEVLTVNGIVQGLAQLSILPRTTGFMHIEEAEHVAQAARWWAGLLPDRMGGERLKRRPINPLGSIQ
jgi:hypothetical protein